eukprot:scaffold4010_cov91-Amphora_coffeaeformis.AAC.1
MNPPFAVIVSRQKDLKEKTANTVAALTFMITLQGESLSTIKLLSLRMNQFSPKMHLSERQLCVDYRQALAEGQSGTRSAVGAHHQNGVAEANIRRFQRMARAMLLHLRLHWPDEFSPDLWLFALDYAV